MKKNSQTRITKTVLTTPRTRSKLSVQKLNSKKIN